VRRTHDFGVPFAKAGVTGGTGDAVDHEKAAAILEEVNLALRRRVTLLTSQLVAANRVVDAARMTRLLLPAEAASVVRDLIDAYDQAQRLELETT
jgi:hypothetical protein